MNLIADQSLLSGDKQKPAIQGKKFWPRAAAYAIDAAIIYGLGYLSGLCVGRVLGILLAIFVTSMGRYYSIAESESNCLNIMVGIIETITYFWIFESSVGRTVGKMVLKMRVISSDGNIPSIKQTLTRAIYRLIDGIFLGWVAASNMKAPGYQRLGDRKASTFVVSSDDTVVKKFPAWWKFWLSLFIYFVFDVTIYAIWFLFYLRID